MMLRTVVLKGLDTVWLAFSKRGIVPTESRCFLASRLCSQSTEQKLVENEGKRSSATGSVHQQQDSKSSETSLTTQPNKQNETKKHEETSIVPPNRSEIEESFAPYRYVYPEFLPDPKLNWRNKIREKLERIDMLKRRSNIDIPEFYVGSILSVTVSDDNAPGKSRTFVGICTEREGTGLRSTFTLRNVVDGEGIEITYDMYNPTIQSITVLKLERRLDDCLRYLRDAAPEYSTVPFDITPEVRAPDAPVPINPIKVKLKSKPWTAKWHLWDLKGIEDPTEHLDAWDFKKMKTWKSQTHPHAKEYDLMKTYRSTIPAEDQIEIYSEIQMQLKKLTQSLRKQKRKRTFVQPQKTA